jgi:3-deoxy-D-manno-octulosonic-acid transferase
MLLFLYNLLLPIVVLAALPFYLRRMLKRGGYARNFMQRFSFFSPELKQKWAPPPTRRSWIRAVSVGEIMLALRLAEEWKKKDPTLQVVISTTTSTGYKLGVERANPEWTDIIYSPLDFYPVVLKFWKHIKPTEVILIDSDLWPSYLAIAHRHNAPVHIVNARLSPRSERRFKKLRSLVKPLFWNHITTFFAQDPIDAQRWEKIGAPSNRIVVTGSIKYDTSDMPETASADFNDWLQKHGVNHRVLLGGSLHPGEESLLIDLFKELQIPDLLLALAPRHVERTPEIEILLKETGLNHTLRTNPQFHDSTSVFVINSTGELKDWYRIATVVVIGKSFRSNGGQNPVEPILAGKPVICGPHMENFQSLIEELVAAKGIIQVQEESQLKQAVKDLLENPEKATQLVRNASQTLEQHHGAILRTVEQIRNQKQEARRTEGRESKTE